MSGRLPNIKVSDDKAEAERFYAEAQEARIKTLEAALQKISGIRDSIIGLQVFNWSEHAYPLVAALNAAGFKGVGFDESRKNFGTLFERIDALKAVLEVAAKALEGITSMPCSCGNCDTCDCLAALAAIRKELS